MYRWLLKVIFINFPGSFPRKYMSAFVRLHHMHRFYTDQIDFMVPQLKDCNVQIVVTTSVEAAQHVHKHIQFYLHNYIDVYV